MSLTDTELIARVLADDDRHAFGELVKRHQSALRAFLRRLVQGDHALADDLAQETLVEAYKNLAGFKGNAAFSSWLLGIAYNRFRQQRRRRKEAPVEELQDLVNACALEGSHEARPEDLGLDLAKALSQLKPEEQTALQLCYAEGLSHEEAAGLMDCPLGTLKSHVLRAKQRLRTFLADYSKVSPMILKTAAGHRDLRGSHEG